MNVGVATIGAIALSVAGWMWYDERRDSKRTRKLTTALALGAGILLGGVLGPLLNQGVTWLIGLAGSTVAAVIGLSVLGVVITVGLVFACLEVIITGILPKKADPRPWHPGLALLLPTLVIARGLPVLSLAIVGAYALGVAGWMWFDERRRRKQTRKTTTALGLLAGIGLGGVLGSLLSQGVSWLIGLGGSPAAAVIGLGVSSVVATVAVGIACLEVIIKGILPKKADPRPWHPVLGLLLPTIVLASGVPLLSQVMGAANNGLGSVVASISGAQTLAPAVGLRAAVVCTTAGGQPGEVAGFQGNQLAHAAEIVAAGQEMGVPQRGQVIAVATAMQESGLKMYANDTVPASLTIEHEAIGSDHDSTGLFQQRTRGWGTLDQRMDAKESAKLFYAKLLALPNWESLPLTVAAQSVQRSAHPDRYAKWEDESTQVVGSINGISCAPGQNV